MLLCAHPKLFGLLLSERSRSRKTLYMFRAIGILIILWGLSLHFGSSIKAFDKAATATFATVEVAALVSQANMQDR